MKDTSETIIISLGGSLIVPEEIDMEFLKGFLENCDAKSVKELAREHPVFVERQAMRHAMDNGYSRKEAKIQAKAGVEASLKSTAADLES